MAGCTPSPPASPVPAPGLPDEEPIVRVGLAVDTAAMTIGATTPMEILSADGTSVLTTVPAGSMVRVTADGGTVRADLPDFSGLASVRARPTGDGFLMIGGKPYRGEAELMPTADGLTVVNEVPMELYLLGVVPFEIGRVGPELLEAAKAQAVAARTYALRYLGRRENLGFDVFATVADQVYGGAEGEHGPVTQAVLETTGEVLTYNGSLVEAFYHSTCAGRTAAIQEVWPEEEARPYLVSVADLDPNGTPYDTVSSRFTWTQRWTAEELTGIFNTTLADSLPDGVSSVGDLRDFEILERTTSGRIARMRITTSNAEFYVGGDRIRWIFLTPEDRILNSSLFDLAVERDRDGAIIAVTADGGGWGHGIGMCQVGAMGRARAGQDYETILTSYYPGAQLARPY